VRKPVLTIFYQYNPWDTSIGGIQTLISNFIKYLPDEFECRLVGIGDDLTQRIGVWQTAELHGKQIQFFPLFSLRDDNVRRIIPTTFRYALALIGKNFASDFMHFHRIEPTLTTGRWKGDKTLFIHNDIRTQFSSSRGSKQAILWKYFPKLYFAIENLLIGQFKQVLSCNQASTQLYRDLYPAIADRFVDYRNTVDTDVFSPLSPSERDRQRQQLAASLNLPETTRFILFAGRLHPQKDPVLLVRSIAALQEPNVHLLLAGDGELADAVRTETKKLGISKQVTMLGAVKQDKLANLHRISSICVLTSVFEGLPLVVLEALACGTPIVTTRAGDTPNILSKNSGVVCEERTPEAIAAAFQEILQNPDHFSAQDCIKTAEPYHARQVIHNIYDAMLKRW
jgi:glycosyltransferase involved in cell wall biosynthesis